MNTFRSTLAYMYLIEEFWAACISFYTDKITSFASLTQEYQAPARIRMSTLYIVIEVYETFSWRLQQTKTMDRTTNSLFYKAPTWHHIEIHLTVDFRRIVEGDETMSEYCEMTRIGEWSVNMTAFSLDKNHIIISNCRAYPWGYAIATLAWYQ